MELITVLESLAEIDSCISWYHVQYQVFLTKSAMYAQLLFIQEVFNWGGKLGRGPNVLAWNVLNFQHLACILQIHIKK